MLHGVVDVPFKKKVKVCQSVFHTVKSVLYELHQALFCKILYNRYGVGYHLTLVKKEGCNQNAVTSLIVSHVPNAQLLSSVGAEMEFLLSSEHSSGFERLFQEIEGKDFVVKMPFYCK